MIHTIRVNASPSFAEHASSEPGGLPSLHSQSAPSPSHLSPAELSSAIPVGQGESQQNSSREAQKIKMMHIQGRHILVHSNRPPLRFDRAFLEQRGNQLKIVQMFCGLLALVLTVHCWPNRWVSFCVAHLWNFYQMFNAVCVHGFFLCGTFLLALAHLFSVPDAFYHYNFPLLEKFYAALALCMHLLGSFFAVYNLTGVSLLPIWIVQVGATLTVFIAYLLDFWIRWRQDRESVGKKGSASAGGGQRNPQYIT